MRILTALYERVTLMSIARALKAHPAIKPFKLGQDLGLGLSCFKFQLMKHDFSSEFQGEELELEIYGLGMAFSERLSIIRAWAEFLERYSFYLVASELGDENQTTSGYASHTFARSARRAALAELVERDLLLSSWLLRLPASRIDLDSVPGQGLNRARVQSLTSAGARIEFALMGRCMGFYAGIGFVSGDSNYGIVASASRSLPSLLDNLVLQAASTVESWTAPNAPTPLETFPEHAWPLDHLRYYLRKGEQAVTKHLLGPEGPVHEFPPFDYRYVNLTADNPYARATGFNVCRAVSSQCQELWIGSTEAQFINLDRLSLISGKPVNYSDLNLEPHPLP